MKRQPPKFTMTATTMISVCVFTSLTNISWMVLPSVSGFVLSQSGCNTGKYCSKDVDEVHVLAYLSSMRRISHSTSSAFLFDEYHVSPAIVPINPSFLCYANDLHAENEREEAAIEKTESVQEDRTATASSDNIETKGTVARDNLPPVIRHVTNERAEFNMNLGKAMDTLRKDMPEILQKSPDFSIYHNQIIAVDPSGMQLQGLDKYKSSFSFLQTFVSFWFMVDHSKIQFRMVYDFCRSSIKLSWHIVLVPKMSFNGNVKPMYLDGISMYDLDASTGKITRHEITNLSINSNSVVPPYNVFSLIASQQHKGQGVPVGAGLYEN